MKKETLINWPSILKNVHSSINYKNISNESNGLENIFINKKTKRNEEIQEIKEFKKNKIFLIKKVKDKSKEMEEDKKEIKKYIYYSSRKFRGVLRRGKSWQVLIMINRNKNYIGNFKSEEEAAKVYDEYAMKFHKEKARLNFPQQGY